MPLIKQLVIILLCLSTLLACSFPNEQRVDEGEVHYILGTSYLREGNPTLALKEFLTAIESEQSGRVHAGLGQAYQLKNAFEKAEKHYKSALRKEPDNPQFANNLAALYLDMERWDGAIRYFEQAVENLLFTNPEIALTGLGSAYFQKHDYPQAIAQFQKAVKIAPRYAQAYYHLGKTYFALDRIDLALRELRHAVELNPGFAAAYYSLGLSHLKLRNQTSARTAFEQVVHLAPDAEIGRLSKDYLKLLR